MSPIGDMLLEAIKKENVTQRSFARTVGLETSMLNMLISGKKQLSVHTAIRIEKRIPSFDSRKALQHQIEIIYKQEILPANHNEQRP